MYSSNAFALKKVIRELLIENFLNEGGFGFEHEINGEKVEDLESWMLDVEHMMRNVGNNLKDAQNQADVRGELAKAPQIGSQK